MEIQKSFNFKSGWECKVSVEDNALLFSIGKGQNKMNFIARDYMQVSGAVKAMLLSGRVSVEETEDSLTLHASPADEATGAPIAAFMAHYRMEKAGENAIRVTSWFGHRVPMVTKILSWMSLCADRRDFDKVYGYDPDDIKPIDAYCHDVHYGSAALSGPKGWVMLTDCGEATWTPDASKSAGLVMTDIWSETGGNPLRHLFPEDAQLCALSVLSGSFKGQDVSIWDEAHPLSTVITFGDGEPAMPSVAPLEAAPCKAPRGTVHTLRSGRLSVAVSQSERGVSMLGISLDDFTPVPEASLAPLCRLVVKNLESGEVLTLSSENDWEKTQVRLSDKRMSIYLEKIKGIDLRVSIEAHAAENDTVIWKTNVINVSKGYSVLNASYPAVNFAGGDVSFFKPSTSGRVERHAYTREERWMGQYPSGFDGLFPVLGVYDPHKKEGSGIYAAIHAPEAARTDMTCAFFRRGQGFFLFDYLAENYGEPANSFTLNGELVVRVLDGDWYDMACIYKDYVSSHAAWYRPLGREDTPQWMKDVPMYIIEWMPNDNPDADPIPISLRPLVQQPRDHWYKKPIELADRLGLPIGCHLYNWHFIPFNNDFPYYFPVKEGLEAGVDKLHAHNVYVMPYINGRICDTRDSRGETVRFDKELRSGATKDMEGNLHIETYASHEPDGSLCRLAAMCPSTTVWSDKLSDIAHKLFYDYNMDAIYLDQVAAAKINMCCDHTHPHTPGNGTWWTKSYRLIMERLHRECPEGRGFTTECNADPFADQFDGFLTWAWVFTNMVPFFSKVYAGHIAMLGRNTNGYKKLDPLFCRFHIGQAVMFGQQIGWMSSDIVDETEKIDYLDRMCHMRWDFKKYFSEGEMLRPPKLESDNTYFLSDLSMNRDDMQPVCLVQTCAWRLPETGQTMIAVTNIGDKAEDVKLSFDCGVKGDAEQKVYGGGKLVSLTDGAIEAHLEPCSCMTFVFESEE